MILLTGSTGFVGDEVLKALSGHNIAVLGRTKPSSVADKSFYTLSLGSKTDFSTAIKSVDCIIHCAARVHIMDDDSLNPLEAYREVNTAGTINFATQAAKSGVSRFIFVSSIKVNGEGTSLGQPFTFADAHCPESDYGLSKAEAEQQLIKIGKETGMEVVIIRPTLVYGPGVKANFASLMSLVSKGIPLPFGCVTNNKRSLVSVDNLVDLIVTCIEHPKAANQVFLVSDDHDVSTSEMLRQMSIALGKSTFQLPVPLWCYKLVGKLFRKEDVIDRLIGSLQVDITHTKKTLGWNPPQSLEDGFKKTAQAFLQSKKKSVL